VIYGRTVLRRRWRSIAFVVVLLLVATAALSDRLVWRPRQDPYAATDAVVVLGGSQITARIALGRELAARQDVPLAISVPELTDPACRRALSPLRVPICFRPDPFTTQGEARWTGAAARARGWRSVTVVMTVDQLARARLRMQRCHVPGLRMAPVPTSRWFRLEQTPYQLAAFVKAETLQRSC
jgi:uncharacterized SAM-binding protein YcdF (DUF218 family)